MAWAWTSPPGVPNAITAPSGWSSMAGLGVSRGRFPGATALAWPGSSQPCEPRDETVSPVPGMIGVSVDTSLGVAENAFPSRSTTATYDVPSATRAAEAGRRRGGVRCGSARRPASPGAASRATRARGR